MNRLHTLWVALGALAVLGVSADLTADDRFWNNPDGGHFGSAGNWDDGSGPVPGAGDAAIFDLETTYTIDFLEDRITDRVIVRRGVVTFGPSGGETPIYTLLNPLASTPSIVVSESTDATLVLAAGAELRGECATVGVGAGHGTLELTAADLRLEQRLHLGLEGIGTLTAGGGASIETGGAALGVLPGATGEAMLSGIGTDWACAGLLALGEKGAGTMTIAGGADVTSDGGIVGQQAGSLGSVSVSGLGSSWIVFDSLDIGMRGTGFVTLEGGASLFNLGFATIGSFPGQVGEGGLGTVRVDGVGSSWSVQGDLWVGFLANGTLILSRGGGVAVDGNLFRAIPGGVTRLIIEIGSASDYGVPALLVGGFTDDFAPRIELVDGFTPALGDRFEIVNAAGGHGAFAFDLPELSEELAWLIEADAATVALEVVTPCAVADLDDNGVIDFVDIIPLLIAWGDCPGCPQDLNHDGVVDFADILLVLGTWGPCP